MYRDTAPIAYAMMEAAERAGFTHFEAFCFAMAAFEQMTTDAHNALRGDHEDKR